MTGDQSKHQHQPADEVTRLVSDERLLNDILRVAAVEEVSSLQAVELLLQLGVQSWKLEMRVNE